LRSKYVKAVAVAIAIALIVLGPVKLKSARPVEAPSTNSNRVPLNPSFRPHSPQLADRPAPEPISSKITPEQSRLAKPGVPLTASALDESVVGAPFPTSPSVALACKRDNFCDELKEDLANMQMEPRDVAWATDMEGRIQGYVASLGPDKSFVRYVECRTSYCAVEVTSNFSHSFVAQFPLGVLFDNLGNGEFALGYEQDASGADVRVTLALFIDARRKVILTTIPTSSQLMLPRKELESQPTATSCRSGGNLGEHSAIHLVRPRE
jgi:hypothetical protein